MIEHDAKFRNCEPLPAWREVAVSNRKASLPRGSGIRAISCVPLSTATVLIENGRNVSQRLKPAKKAKRKCSVNYKPGQNVSFVYRRLQ